MSSLREISNVSKPIHLRESILVKEKDSQRIILKNCGYILKENYMYIFVFWSQSGAAILKINKVISTKSASSFNMNLFEKFPPNLYYFILTTLISKWAPVD